MNWELVKNKLIKAANPKKATGPDHVSPRDLSIIGDPVIHGVLPIFTKSVRDASFPSSWKLSRVNPIFKKGSPIDVNNYRPISLLSIPGKILEDIVSVTLNNLWIHKVYYATTNGDFKKIIQLRAFYFI